LISLSNAVCAATRHKQAAPIQLEKMDKMKGMRLRQAAAVPSGRGSWPNGESELSGELLFWRKTLSEKVNPLTSHELAAARPGLPLAFYSDGSS
jgi:hypothetical protein